MFPGLMSAHLRALLRAATFAAFASSACTSGQTGSPECLGPSACLCDSLYAGGTLLRVRVERFESDELAAVVEQTFPRTDEAPGLIVEGDRVGGTSWRQQPCAPEAAATSLSPGATLLAYYVPGSAGDGSAEQRAAALLDGYFDWAVAWQDPLDFGDSTLLSRSELGLLDSREACLERFPATPAPPCNDSQGSPQCSMARPPAVTGARGSGLLLLAAIATALARRVTFRLSRGRRALVGEPFSGR